MLRALCLAMTILVLPLRSVSADWGTGLGANAALKYWQAFATLSPLTEAEQRKIAAEFLTMPLDAQAREIVTKAEYALQMMRQGAALPHCDWGIRYEDGINVRLPQGPAARVLSALACLRARMRFEEGRNAEAIDDIVASMTLARHVSQDGVMIMVLCGYAIENRTSETLALYLPKLSSAHINDLEARIDALPGGGRLSTALKFEEISGLDWFVRSVKEAKDKESLLALLTFVYQVSEIEAKPGDPRQESRAFLEECGGTAEGVVKLAETVRPLFALAAKMLELPLDQFEKEWEPVARERAGNPVFKLTFAPIDKIRRNQARTDVRRALLSAALAVQLEGPNALKNHVDPVTGGPFEYIAFEGGYELSSKLKQPDDKPWALTVGRRGN